MNLDNIFNLFNDNDDNQYNDDTSLLIDFSDHPLYWIGGFNKLISNQLFFKKFTVKTFQNISPDLNIEELEKAGEELMFRKAWEYIKPFDLSKPLHVDSLKMKANKELVENLQAAILFFEAFEEYEKCALLKKIEDKTKEFLA